MDKIIPATVAVLAHTGISHTGDIVLAAFILVLAGCFIAAKHNK